MTLSEKCSVWWKAAYAAADTGERQHIAANLHCLTEGRLGELISLLTKLSGTSQEGKTGLEGEVLAQWIRPSERFARVQDVL